MRITIDLPADLHQQALSLARDNSRTLSETVVDLVRRALGQEKPAEVSRSRRTGLPLVRLGTPITSEVVRSLDDEQ